MVILFLRFLVVMVKYSLFYILSHRGLCHVQQFMQLSQGLTLDLSDQYLFTKLPPIVLALTIAEVKETFGVCPNR